MIYELAQLNIAVMKDSLDSPAMADFVNNLDRINALAEESAGFVWRLQTEEGDATTIRPLGDKTLINLSIWVDIGALNDYVYKSAHAEIMRRRREWFDRMQEAHFVLWWVPAGHRPTIEEAVSRLEVLQKQGPTALAFNFRNPFQPPNAQGSSPQPNSDIGHADA